MSLIASERAVGYAPKQPRMTAAEFLAWDANQTVKHEFVAGEVFAMAVGEDRNNIAALNLLWPCASTCAAAPAGCTPATSSCVSTPPTA